MRAERSGRPGLRRIREFRSQLANLKKTAKTNIMLTGE